MDQQRPVGRDMIAGHRARNMAPVGGHAIAARGDALDQRAVVHLSP